MEGELGFTLQWENQVTEIQIDKGCDVFVRKPLIPGRILGTVVFRDPSDDEQKTMRGKLFKQLLLLPDNACPLLVYKCVRKYIRMHEKIDETIDETSDKLDETVYKAAERMEPNMQIRSILLNAYCMLSANDLQQIVMIKCMSSVAEKAKRKANKTCTNSNKRARTFPDF